MVQVLDVPEKPSPPPIDKFLDTKNIKIVEHESPAPPSPPTDKDVLVCSQQFYQGQRVVYKLVEFVIHGSDF